MRYTTEDVIAKRLSEQEYYTVTFSIGRWAKVGECYNGFVIKFPRAQLTGKTIEHYYFDNQAEALEYANELRKKVNKHIEGRKVDAYNRGKNLREPFTDADLKRNDICDYRFAEVYPYTYGISVSFTPNDYD